MAANAGVQKHRAPAPTWFRNGFKETIKFIVSGPQQTMEEFVVHRGIAIMRSHTIRQMCMDNPDAVEFKRPEWNASTFNLFIEWLYMQKFYVAFPEGSDSYTPLLRVYMLGRELRTPGLMTFAIYEMCRYSETREVLFNTTHINTIYGCTQPGGALRRLVVDQYACSRDATQLDKITEDSVSKQFLGDLSRRLLSKKSVVDPCQHPQKYHAGPIDMIDVDTENANPSANAQPRPSVITTARSSATIPSTAATGNPGRVPQGTQDLPLFVASDEESDE
ncbi:hypothetical protein BU16DRAFT_620696 [Lophium mytilinum]|uniref:BTB domain-containing protein n=1 Tax=Lophium mytilinum TaxID=390894 RepID=A0A6A6QJB5_9PEZI|nr:hypothetical protein BU16DRAFT_620696 [Lophium mytilinum]